MTTAASWEWTSAATCLWLVMGHNILEYSGFARLCTEYAVASIRQQREIPEIEFQMLLARN